MTDTTKSLQKTETTLLEVILPAFTELFQELSALREELAALNAKVTPNQEWFDLKQGCNLKGINYNTVISNPKYQPNFGKPDAIICGRRRWRRQTILDWLQVTDEDLPKGRKLNALIGGGK